MAIHNFFSGSYVLEGAKKDALYEITCAEKDAERALLAQEVARKEKVLQGEVTARRQAEHQLERLANQAVVHRMGRGGDTARSGFSCSFFCSCSFTCSSLPLPQTWQPGDPSGLSRALESILPVHGHPLLQIEYCAEQDESDLFNNTSSKNKNIYLTNKSSSQRFT